MNITPKVSVIIPIYNQEKYLSETIDSVLNQTFTDFELILIDDGSKDRSIEIAQRYAMQDDRIVTIFQSNTGKPAAINKAASIAKGEYIAFMDHDDLMLPYRLEKQITFHSENPYANASSCHCYYINENGIMMGTQKFSGPTTEYEARNVKSEIITCAFTGLMVRTNDFIRSGGLRSEFWPTDDLEFFNRFIEQGNLLVINQEILMKYRAHSSSATIANSWHSYVSMNDYTTTCIKLRRSGKEEISYMEFEKNEKAKSWLEKLNRRRLFHAMVLQKEAGFSMYTGKYAQFLLKIILASMLCPSFVIATARKRLNNI